MKKSTLLLTVFLFFVFDMYSQSNQWAWMKGDNTYTYIDSSYTVYGPVGSAGNLYRPGIRGDATMWTDLSGNIWLFGGNGSNDGLNGGKMNDLWKYNPLTNEWAWMKGDNIVNSAAVYSNANTLLNKPGARYGAAGWVDASNNLYLFGGYGITASVSDGMLNDLWRYTPGTNTWTWIKGDNTADQVGVYSGAATALKPGGRNDAVAWIDGNNLYLFGGAGRAATSTVGQLNDLWRYNITTANWTFIKGDNALNVSGVYSGAAAALKPGSRYSATSWVDATGKACLFGGRGYAASTSIGTLNDLWRYDPGLNTWTWLKGDNTTDNNGVYGLINQSNINNKPGSRSTATGWSDANGDLWLFGGYGLATFTSNLNDLWKYNKTTNEWTWMHGANIAAQTGIYGTQGVPDNIVHPGARSSMVACKGTDGNFWIYGGNGYGYTSGSNGYLNELWKFNPVTKQWTWVRHNNAIDIYHPSHYGTQGNTNALNTPGGRAGGAAWTDAANNYWLFGGNGRGSLNTGLLNDLWKYVPGGNTWTWIKGDSTTNRTGIYGQSTALDKPGSRRDAATWKDNNGNLWLFGGDGYGNSARGWLSDLWKYSSANNTWTWVKGDSSVNNIGIYNQSSSLNKPGGRTGASTWVDAAGNLWLFGGYGVSAATEGRLNDLWKYNTGTNEWTFVKGDTTPDFNGDYGVQGISNGSNKPGGRSNAAAWIDGTGSIWLFGGNGFGLSSLGNLNDLWKFNPVTGEWIWMKGSDGTYTDGVYGTMGIPAASNNPGSRDGTTYWFENNNLWLHGGRGESASGSGMLNDLWKYSTITNQWIWVTGNNSAENIGEYATQGTFDPANNPGSRFGGSAWKSTGSQLWLFGGYGYDTNTPSAELNDLWKYELPCSGSITLNPLPGLICFDGNPVSLTASGGTSYVWYKNGSQISGATGATYPATTVGSYYVKGSVGACANIYSNEVILQSPAVPPGLGGTGVYCLGDPVNIGIPVTEPGQNYTWKQNTISVYGPIGGNGGNQSLQFNLNSITQAGTYIVESTKAGCSSVFSNYVYVGLAAITNLSITSFCTDRVSFNWDRVVPQNVSQSYQYLVSLSSSPPASGTNTSANSQTITGLNPSATYYIHVRSACGFNLTNFGDWTTISFTTPASSPPAGTAEWTGASNNVWSNTANWKCGQVPVNTTAVVINGGKPNYPSVTSNLIVKSLTVNAGASVQVSPGVVITLTGL